MITNVRAHPAVSRRVTRVTTWLGVAVPVVGFALGCTAPCGKGHAPKEASVVGWPETFLQTGDTGAGAVCDSEASPGLELIGLEGDVSFVYRSFCDITETEKGVGGFEILTTGLSSEADVTLSYVLVVDRDDPVTDATPIGLVCGDDGVAWSKFDVNLPERADGREVRLELELVDTNGSTVSTSATFVAHVTEE